MPDEGVFDYHRKCNFLNDKIFYCLKCSCPIWSKYYKFINGHLQLPKIIIYGLKIMCDFKYLIY